MPSVLFKSFWALDGVSVLIGAETTLEIFDRSLTSSSDRFEVGAVFGFLRLESFRKSMIPSCLGRRQGVVDATLNVVSLFSEGGDEILVSIFAVGGALQLVDSRGLILMMFRVCLFIACKL